MIQETSYLKKATELLIDLINHGHGDIHIHAEGLKGGDKTKLQILYGRSYVFFIKKEIDFNKGDII
jgi:hypothetical protein